MSTNFYKKESYGLQCRIWKSNKLVFKKNMTLLETRDVGMNINNFSTNQTSLYTLALRVSDCIETTAACTEVNSRFIDYVTKKSIPKFVLSFNVLLETNNLELQKSFHAAIYLSLKRNIRKRI